MDSRMLASSSGRMGAPRPALSRSTEPQAVLRPKGGQQAVLLNLGVGLRAQDVEGQVGVDRALGHAECSAGNMAGPAGPGAEEQPLPGWR